MSVADPFEVPAEALEAGLTRLDAEQKDLFRRTVDTLREAAQANHDAETALRAEVQNLQRMVSQLPTSFPQPEPVDLDGAVRSVVTALDGRTARLRADVSQLRQTRQPRERGPMTITVVSRDDKGDIKAIEVESR